MHGDGAKFVHLTVAPDHENRRWTDRIFGMPLVGEVYQMWVFDEIEGGTRFGFLYKVRPGAAEYLDDTGITRVVEAAQAGDVPLPR